MGVVGLVTEGTTNPGQAVRRSSSLKTQVSTFMGVAGLVTEGISNLVKAVRRSSPLKTQALTFMEVAGRAIVDLRKPVLLAYQ